MEKTEQPPHFTPQAQAMWLAIPANTRAMLLENVYCRHCRVTTIVDFRGSIKQGSVVLEGQCKKCGAEVARVID